MSKEITDLFSGFGPEEMQAAIKVFGWVASEQADNNNIVREQTKVLEELLKSQKELQRFFTTAEKDGFSALRQEKLDDVKNSIIHENKSTWVKITSIFTGLIALVSGIFWWIQNNGIKDVINILNHLAK